MKIFIPLLILFMLFINSCKNEPTAPENNETPAETLAEATIGPEGGTLETGNFKLNIPAGALSGQVELKLYSSAAQDPFDENRRSDLFRLEGFPEDFSKPLSVSIKYNSALEDQSFIVVGEEGVNAHDGSVDVIYDFWDVTDSSGFLVTNIPVEEGGGDILKTKSSQNSNWKVMQVISGFFGGKDKYEIYYPKTGVNPGFEIVTSLDDAFRICLDSLRLDLHADIPKIFVGDLGDEKYCTFRWRNPTAIKKEKSVIGINSKKMNDLENMKIMIGREILRFFLFGYDPQFPVMVGPTQQNHHWLNEAVISWAEQFFVPTTERNNYIPTGFKGNELAPFNGLHAGKDFGGADAITNATNHGRGMSSFIKYLFANQESRDIKGIYDGIRSGEHPVKCIDELIKEWSFAQNISTRWIDYFPQYIKGSIYGVNQGVLINGIQAENTFTINEKEDTLKTCKFDYPDLSAKMFRVNFDYKEIDPKAELYIEIKPEISLFDFKYASLYLLQSSKLTEAGRLYSSYIIPKIRDLVDNDKDLFVLIVNGSYKGPTYTNTTEIELKFKVQTTNFNKCRIDLIVLGEFKYPYQGNNLLPVQLTWEGSISYFENDNTYEGFWNEDRNGDNYVGNLVVKVDPQTKNIKYFTAENTKTDTYGDKYLYDITSKNIDLAVNNDGDSRDYKVFGSSVCDYIESLDYAGGDQYTGFTLANYSCNGDSYLNIYFYSEE